MRVIRGLKRTQSTPPPPSPPPRLVALAPLEPWMARITNVCYLLSIVIVSPSLISLHTTDEAAAFVQDMERYAREQRQRMQPPSAPRAAWLVRVETPHTLDLSSGGGSESGHWSGCGGRLWVDGASRHERCADSSRQVLLWTMPGEASMCSVVMETGARRVAAFLDIC